MKNQKNKFEKVFGVTIFDNLECIKRILFSSLRNTCKKKKSFICYKSFLTVIISIYEFLTIIEKFNNHSFKSSNIN